MTATKKIDSQINISSKSQSPDLHHSIGSLLFLTLIFFGAVILFLTLVHHVPIIQTLAFFLGTIVFFTLPGRLVLDILNWKDNPVSLTILSTLTGMALCPILYYLVSIIGHSWIFLLVIVPASAYTLFTKLRIPGFKAGLSAWHPPRHWWKGFLLLLAVLALLHVSHFSDLAITGEDSYQLRTTQMTETVFHLGIINVAEHTLPPFYPYANGYSLADYHIDMHLLAVMFTRFLGIDPLIMTYYFLPLLLMLMLAAMPAVFFYHLHANLDFSLLLGLLVFSADLSFIPALLKGLPASYPWTLTFCTSIWSLFTLNGIMLAIPLLFGALTAFQRYFTMRDLRHLVVFSLFAIAASRVKSSMGLQIVGTAFPALAFIVWRYRFSQWWKPLLVFISTALVIFFDILNRTLASPSTWIFKWQPFSGLIESAARLGWTGLIEALRSPLEHPLIVSGGLIFYVAGFMGVRLVCLKYLSDIFRTTREKVYEVVPFLIIFILGGVVLSECIYLGGRNDPINNGVWFRVQAIIAATYFVAAFLFNVEGKARRYIAVILVLLLSFPSTFQFLSLRHDTAFTSISRDEIQLVDFMKTHVPDNAVVLEYPLSKRPSPAANLAGRSSVLALFRTFLFARLSPEVFEERRKDIITFFTTDDPKNLAPLMRKHHADYLLVPAQLSSRYYGYTWIDKVYENSQWCLYQAVEKKNYE